MRGFSLGDSVAISTECISPNRSPAIDLKSPFILIWLLLGKKEDLLRKAVKREAAFEEQRLKFEEIRDAAIDESEPLSCLVVDVEVAMFELLRAVECWWQIETEDSFTEVLCKWGASAGQWYKVVILLACLWSLSVSNEGLADEGFRQFQRWIACMTEPETQLVGTHCK